MFGEFVHPRGDAAWVGTLVEWMRTLGFSEPAVRAAVSRSLRTGWLEARKVGRRSYYALAPAVRWRVHRAVSRLYEDPPAWDGRWRVLVYSIPERERARRDRLRKELSVLGLGALAPGVWVTPNPLGAEALELARAHGLEGSVEVFEAARLSGLPDAGLVGRAWDLQETDRRYAGFLEAFREEPRPDTDEAAFREYVRALHEYRKFLFRDPGLPPELQPRGFRGPEAARLFRARRLALASRVDAFVARTFEAPPDA